ncbi:uncharacterized protein [Ptychodera flava]|uniref:uncharacterized protein n=1 Tax=Ptychodera flava TaxID=63121 RepID=UPI003969DD1F
MTSLNPLRLLFNQLNGKISEAEERSLRGLLRDSDPGIPTKDLDKLKTTSEIFIDLEQRGHISRHDLNFLKSLLEAIDRKPLIDLVIKCEDKLASEPTNEERSEQTGRPESRDLGTPQHQADSGNAGLTALAGAIQGLAPSIGQLFGNQTHHFANGYFSTVYIRRFNDTSSASRVSSAVRRKIDQLESDEDSRLKVSEILIDKEYQPVSSRDVTNFKEDVISVVTDDGVIIAEAHQIPYDRSVIVTSRPDIVPTKYGKLWVDEHDNYH